VNISTGVAFTNISLTGGFGVVGGSLSTNPMTVDHGGTTGLTVVTMWIRSRASQTGRLLQFLNNANTELSYFTPTDGAFHGPVYASTADVHPDNVFQIVGSADATKIAIFEVDGLTTATTRTMTVPDYSGTLIVSQGSATLGQTIGTNAASHTSGTANDLAIEGKLLLGPGNASSAFVTSILSVSATGTAPIAQLISAPTSSNLTAISASASLAGISSALSGSFRLMTNSITGTPTSSSGTVSTLSAFLGTVNIGVPASTSITFLSGGDFQVSVGNVDGTITQMFGNRAIMLGPTGGAGSIGSMGAMLFQTNQRAGVISGTMAALQFSQGAGVASGAVANFVGIDFQASSIIANTSATVNWTGIRIANASSPTGYKIAIEAQMPIISNKLRLDGAVPSSVTHWLEIAAGTTTVAPILLTSATPITTPVAGTVEFQTDNMFLTITTGPARKAFVLDDGTRLTSGRVPFATTNGRLIDDADFTFATDTLTITKIAATQFTGDVTIADGINLVLNTTTGTKIGTANTQKLGFWNTVPVAQPTTAVGAATLVGGGGTTITDTDTFDGYTLKQIVAALRLIGLLQ